MKIEGWSILFHPMFAKQRSELVAEVTKLKSKLSKNDFIKHPQVKLLKALTVAIEQKIPQNPRASYFALKKPLDKYSRLKKMGLPQRYRLFFKVFVEQKTLLILWLGFPRKDERPRADVRRKGTREEEGDRKDCYRVFEKMIKNGVIPQYLSDME